ncbi:MAG: YajQ family cyclic di-GMP-binding protein [Deltaproteobacteria bacterium]|nr:YajQ family cyclic di-GMP-binding protein [Deltaproteobacteria bacterium]
MPSFDIVSKVDTQEVKNAVNQANQEVGRRFDFKGANAKFEFDNNQVIMRAPNEFQLKQMFDILTGRLASRKVDIRCLHVDPPQVNVGEAWQPVTIRQGINADLAKKIVKMIKDEKFKVQVAIQGEQVRVSGKKRDDLQQVIRILKDAKLDMPLQFDNYRD